LDELFGWTGIKKGSDGYPNEKGGFYYIAGGNNN